MREGLTHFESRRLKISDGRNCNSLTLALIFVIGFLNEPVNAGPDEITSRLMEEEVSLLDWGVIRIQLLLDDIPGAAATVYFDWESNRFKVIGSNFSLSDKKLGPEVIGECERWFTVIRRAAYVNEGTGKPYSGESSLFSELFSHAGWTSTVNGKSTTDIVNDLDSKFELEYSISLDATVVGEVERLICSAPLLSNSFARQEIKKN